MGPRPLQRSGKYHRRQASATRQNDGILRFQRVEDGEKLRLGSAAVPFPVSAEQVQQLVHSLGWVVGGQKGGGKVKAGLMVVRVGFHGGAQLCLGPGIGGLAGKFQLGAGGIEFLGLGNGGLVFRVESVQPNLKIK